MRNRFLGWRPVGGLGVRTHEFTSQFFCKPAVNLGRSAPSLSFGFLVYKERILDRVLFQLKRPSRGHGGPDEGEM